MEKMHTPEPWHTAERSGFPFHIDDARGESVAVMLADDDHDEQRGLENARRIVACVNACAGIPTELLERFKTIVGSMDEVSKIEKQRDELLAALEKMTDVFANIGITSGLYDDEQDALKSACSAIAAAKGGAS